MKTTKKNGLFIGLVIAAGIGTVVGASSAARGRLVAPATAAVKVTSLDGLPLPALDRMTAKLAAEARARKH